MAAGDVCAQNLRWGPFRFSLGFVAGLIYDDNVNTSEKDPIYDVKMNLGPTIDGGVYLPFAGGEQFTLSMSASYQKSLTGNDSDNFGAPLGASLTLPITIENWRVVLGDVFTFTNDPLESSFAANRSKVTQFGNTVSGSATRQFGRLATTFGVQRNDKIFPDDPEQEETIYQASFTPAFFFRENYSVFWRNTVGLTFPGDPNSPNQTGWSSEIGLSGQITPYLSGTVSAGFAHSHLKSYRLAPTGTGIFGGIFNPNIVPADNVDGPSVNMGLAYTHPLRPNTAHSLAFYYNPGVTALLKDSNIQSSLGAAYGLAHRLTPKLILSPGVLWTHLQDVGQVGAGEVADIIGVRLAISRVFNEHFSGSIDYRFQSRMSNLDGQSYEDNRVGVSLNYIF